MSGMAVGPLVGGAMLEVFWWGSVFLLGVPIMLLLLLSAPLLLPECRDAHAGRLDLTSVVVSLATILPIVYGLKDVAPHGLHALPIVAMLVGVAFGLLFVYRQQRLANPLLDLHLLGNRAQRGARQYVWDDPDRRQHALRRPVFSARAGDCRRCTLACGRCPRSAARWLACSCRRSSRGASDRPT
jgi:hypothetical protein